MIRALLFCILLAPTWVQAVTCDCYLRSSDGNDADDCSTWALASATLADAFTNVVSGQTICVDDDHDETGTVALSYSGEGAVGNPVRIITVVTDTTTPVSSPPASYMFGGDGGNDYVRLDGHYYFYGVNFQVGDGLQIAGNLSSTTFENSKLTDRTTDIGSVWGPYSGDSNSLVFIDTDIQEASFRVKLGGTLLWHGGSYISIGTEYDYLIQLNNEGGKGRIDGVDLSAWSGATALVESAWAAVDEINEWRIINSKLPSSYVLFSGTPTGTQWDDQVLISGSDDASEYWRSYGSYYAGDVEHSTAVNRTGGSTYDGTNEFSIEINTNASALEGLTCVKKHLRTFVVDLTLTKNIAVHITYDSASAWLNDDFCLRAKYQDATNEALGKWVTNCPTAAIHSPDSADFTDVSATETWNGTSGFTNAREETIDLDIPAGSDEGLVELWGYLCKPSSTIYVDLLPDVT